MEVLQDKDRGPVDEQAGDEASQCSETCLLERFGAKCRGSEPCPPGPKPHDMGEEG